MRKATVSSNRHKLWPQETLKGKNSLKHCPNGRSWHMLQNSANRASYLLEIDVLFSEK